MYYVWSMVYARFMHLHLRLLRVHLVKLALAVRYLHASVRFAAMLEGRNLLHWTDVQSLE